jgi:hypothetical protein
MHYQRISQIKFYTSLTPFPLLHVTTAQSRQNARLLLQSSELGSCTTHTQASESPSFGSGGDTLAWRRGGGGPNSDEGIDTVVL